MNESNTNTRDELIDASRAFAMLGLPTSSGWALLARGEIPRGIKIGRRTRLSRKGLEKWIAEQHAAAQSASTSN